MGDAAVMDTGSLDDVMQDNPSETQRRRSIPAAYSGPMVQHQDQTGRRMSMMEFGGAYDHVKGYPSRASLDPQYANMPGLTTGLSHTAAAPGTYSGDMTMTMPASMDSGFSAQNMLAFSGNHPFANFSPDMVSMMPATFANMNMDSLGSDMADVHAFSPSPLASHFPAPALTAMNTAEAPMAFAGQGEPLSVHPNTTTTTTTAAPTTTNPMDMAMEGPGVSMGPPPFAPVEHHHPTAVGAAVPSAGNTAGPHHAPPAFHFGAQNIGTPSIVPIQQPPQPPQPPQPSQLPRPEQATVPPPSTKDDGGALAPASPVGMSPISATPPTSVSRHASSSNAATPVFGPQPPGPGPGQKSVYSASGFDMLRALWYVATRKNPEVHLGAVDMSCAFLVCDVTLNDCPIIYVSDNFQNLTAYSRHEIMGRNCRFLQAPDGNVEAGSKREFVDNAAVLHIREKLAAGREVQQSLINYRKGGKPFLNLLTLIPIPWDNPDEIRYIVGFQIDLIECPDAIGPGRDMGGVQVNYKHSDIGQYIWTPPSTSQWEAGGDQTLGMDDVSTLLQRLNRRGLESGWHRQSWDKMLLENTDDVVHVLSLKGLFLYLSPSCKRILEYDASELAGNALSTVCHPSDIVPVTRELKDTTAGNPVNIVFRIRRKNSGYTWFESHGSLFVEQGKGRKSIVLVGRKRPVFALSRRTLEAHGGGIGDSELWTKLSTSGMFLFVSSNVRSLLDLQPGDLVGTSIQDLMRKESRAEFNRTLEKARRGAFVTCKHEVQNRRGQVLQAQTVLYPGDVAEGQKPTFLLAQTKLLKATSRAMAPAAAASPPGSVVSATHSAGGGGGGGGGGSGGSQALVRGSTGGTTEAAAADDNLFDELRTTKCSSWQFELRQMEKVNRILAEELGGLLSNKKKRKRRKGVGNVARDCANCHTRNTPEWRRGPSGQRDLCNSCGLRWAKQVSFLFFFPFLFLAFFFCLLVFPFDLPQSNHHQVGRVSPRNSSRGGNKTDAAGSRRGSSPARSSSLHKGNGNGREGRSQSLNGGSAGNLPDKSAAAAAAAVVQTMMPPPSQPRLEGGSGAGITSIREDG